MKVKSQLIDAQLEQRSTSPTKKGEILIKGADFQYNDGLNPQTVATTGGTQEFTNKSYSSPALNGVISGDAFLDEDDMVSNSATKLASQQSIKAYVDLQVGGGESVTTQSSAYTALASDDVILCDASSAAFTVTLPPASANSGKVLTIKKIDSDNTNAVTVDGDGSETIDGELSVDILYQNDFLRTISDGTNWRVLSKKQNKFQTKILASSVTSDGVISSLTFNNLVIGKPYQVTGRISIILDVTSADITGTVFSKNNGDILDTCSVTVNESADTANDAFYLALSFKFIAAGTTLTFEGSSISTGSQIFGGGTRSGTYVQLEERNDLVETTDF